MCLTNGPAENVKHTDVCLLSGWAAALADLGLDLGRHHKDDGLAAAELSHAHAGLDEPVFGQPGAERDGSAVVGGGQTQVGAARVGLVEEDDADVELVGVRRMQPPFASWQHLHLRQDLLSNPRVYKLSS